MMKFNSILVVLVVAGMMGSQAYAQSGTTSTGTNTGTSQASTQSNKETTTTTTHTVEKKHSKMMAPKHKQMHQAKSTGQMRPEHKPRTSAEKHTTTRKSNTVRGFW